MHSTHRLLALCALWLLAVACGESKSEHPGDVEDLGADEGDSPSADVAPDAPPADTEGDSEAPDVTEADMGEGDATEEDAAAPDMGGDPCGACLPEGGLPALGEVNIKELPVGARDTCEGVCVGTNEGPGRCLFPEQPGVTCDHREKGFGAEMVDPMLGDEPYQIMDASRGGNSWCSDCRCDGERCEGRGAPFDRKRSRVYVPENIEPREELFLFLGGTGGNCDIHKWIGTMAATAGYRSLCLSYINDPSGEAYCAEDALNDPGSTCGYDFRWENLFGEDRSEKVQIGARNAIVGRLRAVLQALERNAPGQGFGAYLRGDEIAWEKIAVGGFSQGGGNVGILAEQFPLARAVYFSKAISPIYSVVEGAGCATDEDCFALGYEICLPGPGACARADQPAYASNPRMTLAARSYLIVHNLEGAQTYSPDTARLWGMDLCGDLFNVDGHEGDYGCGHMLTTNAEPDSVSDGSEAGYHGSMGSDGAMSKDADGYPANQRAYLYMMMAR
jgi:hypothetical protein